MDQTPHGLLDHLDKKMRAQIEEALDLCFNEIFDVERELWMLLAQFRKLLNFHLLGKSSTDTRW